MKTDDQCVKELDRIHSALSVLATEVLQLRDSAPSGAFNKLGTLCDDLDTAVESVEAILELFDDATHLDDDEE